MPLPSSSANVSTPIVLSYRIRPLFENSLWLNLDLLGDYGVFSIKIEEFYCFFQLKLVFVSTWYSIIMHICYHYPIAQKYIFLSYLITSCWCRIAGLYGAVLPVSLGRGLTLANAVVHQPQQGQLQQQLR